MKNNGEVPFLGPTEDGKSGAVGADARQRFKKWLFSEPCHFISPSNPARAVLVPPPALSKFLENIRYPVGYNF